jgi:hypothetical protein
MLPYCLLFVVLCRILISKCSLTIPTVLSKFDMLVFDNLVPTHSAMVL